MKKNGFKAALFILFFSIICSVTTVQALDFPTFFKFKFENWEYFNPDMLPGVTAPDGIEDNWGVAQVISISDLEQPAALPTWQAGDDGEEIRIFFYGLDLAYWDATSGAYGMTPVSTGAYLDMYLWDSDDADYVPFDLDMANRSVSGTSYTSVTTGGVHLARFEFTYGTSSNPAIVTSGTTSDFSNPPTGTGSGFIKVIPGSGTMADAFNQNAVMTALDKAGIAYNPAWIDPDADIYIQFDFSPLTTPIGGFQLRSDDPGYGAVPEPATLMLMGSGFLLAGGFGRKKFFKKRS